jgi:hypothetical protein
MAELLRNDFNIEETKKGYLRTLDGLEAQINAAKLKIDDCNTALTNNSRLISERSEYYTNEKDAANDTITQAKQSILNLRDKIAVEGNHTEKEIGEFTSVYNGA